MIAPHTGAMRASIFVLALSMAACGGRVVDDANANGSGVTGAPASDGEATPIAQMAICGTPACFGRVETGTRCRSAGEWSSIAAASCTGAFKVVYLEFSDPCEHGFLSARYGCCPEGTPVEPLTPSSPNCPAAPDTWELGKPCTAPLWCNYPDACGHNNGWHCKHGTWQSNSGCYCAAD